MAPLVSWGPATFIGSGVGGYAPTKIAGPVRANHIVEHEVPAREGGVIEYLGSKQPTYQLKGFLAPTPETIQSGVSLSVLSGQLYYGLGPDDSLHYLQGLRGSGAQLLRLESVWSNTGNGPILYENDFFYATNMTFGMEAGRGYPYYPYGIDLMRASYATWGNTSGTTTLGNDAGGATSGAYLSGYYRAYTYEITRAVSAAMGLGFYALAVHGTYHAQMAIAGITSGGPYLATTASQVVNSGFNYFPLNPSVTLTSGTTYNIVIGSDAPNNGAWALAYTDAGATGLSSLQSGIAYSLGFGAGFLPGSYSDISGYALDIFVVTP